MRAIGYYFALPFIYLISILPFPLLYLVSDIVFLLLYYGIGYRRSIVTGNLRRSFPEKSEKEISELQKKFYGYLSDLLLETFKTLTISRTTMLAHCSMNEDSIRLMNKLYDEQKSCILVLGHLGNWEWGGNTFSLVCKQPLYVIYHPLKNEYFNHLIIRMRTRFGTRLTEMKNTFRAMTSNKKEVSATAFIADQSPPPENAYWTRFMHQDTPVFRGTETIARKLNYPVVFMNVHRLRRGYYELRAEMLCENPAATSEGEISNLHTQKLESAIRQDPETWLWTHRRWKHDCPN